MRGDGVIRAAGAGLSLLTGSCTTATPPPATNGFLGVRAVVLAAPPGGAAAAWYEQLFGGQTSMPVYGDAGFAVGAAELDLDSQASVRTLTVWEVENIDAAFARLVALGAVPVTGIEELGAGRVAIVRDPFGNLLGVTEVAPRAR
jgi:predicted enzyme related to lactoylglutathione lyase